MFTVYILYSQSSDRYYVGYTGDVIEERIRKHNTHHRGYTGKSADWIVVYQETFVEKKDASKREKEIKPGFCSRKSIPRRNCTPSMNVLAFRAST